MESVEDLGISGQFLMRQKNSHFTPEGRQTLKKFKCTYSTVNLEILILGVSTEPSMHCQTPWVLPFTDDVDEARKVLGCDCGFIGT